MSSNARFTPSSAEHVTQLVKNLSWMFDYPLQTSHQLYAECLGYSDAAELRGVLARVAANKQLPSPFLPLRPRPLFDADLGVGQDKSTEDAGLIPLSPWEVRFTNRLFAFLVETGKYSGHYRRRVFAVLDAGFFCEPSVHRSAMQAVKAGITAMEASDDASERYLECNWPVGYWAFIEWDSHFHAELSPEAFSKLPPLNFRDQPSSPHVMQKEIAAYRAPMVYNIMANSGKMTTEAWDWLGPWTGDPVSEPAVFLNQAGLFPPRDYDTPGEPEGTRLFELRSLSLEYQEYVPYMVMLETSRPWPGQVSAGVPPSQRDSLGIRLLMTASALDEVSAGKVWTFTAYYTKRDAGSSREEAVARLQGELINPLSEDGSTILTGEAIQFGVDNASMRLNYLTEGYLHRYLPSEGFDSTSDHSRDHDGCSFAIGTLDFLPKYKDTSLDEAIFGLFVELCNSSETRGQEAPENWYLSCDFNLSSVAVANADTFELESRETTGMVGTFLVPHPAAEKAKYRHLKKLDVGDSGRASCIIFPFTPSNFDVHEV